MRHHAEGYVRQMRRMARRKVFAGSCWGGLLWLTGMW